MSLSPEREGRLTASDHGSALGLNPYCSRQELWRRWNGMAEPHSPETLKRFSWGTEHEADAVSEFESETGLIVSFCLERQLFVPFEDWSGCTPDGLIGDDSLLECKCPTKIWDEPPIYYWAQVQSQLKFTGRSSAYLTAWTPETIAVWLTPTCADYWPTAEPILKTCWKNLVSGMEPKRSKKPTYQWEVKWTRIA